MNMIVLDKFGIPRKLKDVAAVERLFKLKETSGSNPWPVIGECLRIWEKSAPRTWDSFLFNLEATRETRKDKTYGSTVDKETGGILRYTLDIPEKVIYMLRTLYTPDELPMNREFYRAFANRYPKFKVAEKI